MTQDGRTAGAPTVGGTTAGSGPDGRGATGDAAVDEALLPLTSLAGTPVRDHVAVFEAVHAALQARLADDED